MAAPLQFAGVDLQALVAKLNTQLQPASVYILKLHLELHALMLSTSDWIACGLSKQEAASVKIAVQASMLHLKASIPL